MASFEQHVGAVAAVDAAPVEKTEEGGEDARAEDEAGTREGGA